jgi:hypothetical protein
MALGIRGANPIWAEFDLQGNLFDDTFYLFVLQNTIPYLPATVYHDPDLNLPWTNPIQFLGNGTLPIDIYFESDVVYRLEFRQGPTQSDPLIYEVNNYIAGTGGSTPVDTVAFASSNQITNPQFAVTNFVSPYAIVSATDPDPIEIGPGWFLELAGTGSVTLTKVPLSSATPNPSNAPYALRITLTGWNANSTFLRQRFQQNGMLWANKIVSSTLTARVEGSAIAVSANLIDSNGTTLAEVLDVPSINGSFNEFTGYGDLPATSNPDVPPAAYIDYKLGLPNNIDIYVTSIQLVVQELPIEPSFEQDSIDRQIDHTFHYYKDPLIQKPISSHLVGWDFALNPAQEFGNTVAASAIGANKSKYVWDQTIIFQSANSGVGVTRDNSGAIKLTAAAATQTALIQYLGVPATKDMLEDALSTNIAAYCSAAAGLKMTVSLWYTTDVSLPVVTTGTNNSLVLTLDANGKPATFNGTWVEVPRINGLGNATFTVSQKGATEDFFDYNFNGWSLEGDVIINSATFFAIVIGTAPMAMNDTVTFDSVSLNSGTIATRPAPQTPDEVIRQCQYFYEKSYNVDVPALPAPVTFIGMFIAEQLITTSGGSDHVIARSFWLPYKQTKRVAPGVGFRSINGTLTTVTAFIRQSGAVAGSADVADSNWTGTGIGKDSVSFLGTGVNLLGAVGTAGTFPEGYIGLHYVLDARYGIV